MASRTMRGRLRTGMTVETRPGTTGAITELASSSEAIAAPGHHSACVILSVHARVRRRVGVTAGGPGTPEGPPAPAGLVSVVIPTFNRAALLPRAVKALLDQT